MTIENKLPEIGQRYKDSKDNIIMEVINSCESLKYVTLEIKDRKLPHRLVYSFKLEEFFKNFEELPDQEPITQTGKIIDLQNKIINKHKKEQELKENLQEAIEDVEEYINSMLRKGTNINNVVNELIKYTKTLINTLKSQDHISQEGKKVSNNGKECKKCDHKYWDWDPCCGDFEAKTDIVETKTDIIESIWKPISELPIYRKQTLVKIDKDILQGYFIDRISCLVFIGLDGSEWGFGYLKEYCYLTDFINNQEILEERIAKLEQLIKEK